MSYFQSKSTAKPVTNSAPEPRLDSVAQPAKPAQQVVSTLGPGMLVTGNIVCTGAVQIFGRVVGDIHAAKLVICEGADVQGKVTAQEAVIDGSFKGTIHGNTVKLQSTAVVDGEIFNKSLTIEQNAQFEGVARRLDKAVDAPAETQLAAEAPTLAPAPVAAPAAPTQAYGANGSERPSWVS
ncbi:MAG: polymer-forming cytoskeletal protein [Pseudolabrys sp.]